MAQFYLDRDTKAELGYSSSPVSVNGTAGSQDRIILRSNATEVAVSSAVEIVDFAGSVSAYSFQAAGRGVAVYRGDDLVATVAFNDAGSSELRFSEGGIVFTQDADTGAYTVGGWTVPAGEESVPEAWGGEASEINTEHKSEAGGGVGPVPGPTPGKGENYELPKDLGEGNIVTSGTGNDTYATTEADGLKKDAQIIDGSTADEDVLTMSFSKRNENGSIVNVEKIVANWTGYDNAKFTAEEISHVNGAEITLNSARSVFDKAVVTGLQNHRLVAGTNIKEITISGAEDGASVTMGSATKLTVDALANAADATETSSDVLAVNAEKDFELILNDTTKAGYKDKDGDDVIVVNASKDVTVKAGTGVNLKDASGDGTNISRAADSAGKVTVDFGTNVVSGDVSGLKVDVIRTETTSNTFNKLDAGTTVLLAGLNASGAFTYDDADFIKDSPNAGTARVELGETKAGTLDIGDAGVGTLLITVSHDTEIGTLTGRSSQKEDAAAKKEAVAADKFVISGKGDVTVSGGFTTTAFDGTPTGENHYDLALIAGDDYAGRLIVNDLRGGIVVAGQGGSEASTSAVSGNITYAGGAGEDSWTVASGGGTLTVDTDRVLVFDGGAGDDTVEIGSGSDAVQLSDGSTGGKLVLDMGDGDDTVTINALTISGSGSLGIDFGAGSKDTLKIVSSSGVTLPSDGEAAIRGMEILNVTAGALTVAKQDIFGAWDFQVKGNNLTIQLDGTGDLDISGLTSPDKAMSKVGVNAGMHTDTVTLSTNLSETVTVASVHKYNDSGTKPFTSDSKAVTLANFKANAEDKIIFNDASGSGSIPVGGGVKVKKFREDDYKDSGDSLTLDELLEKACANAASGASNAATVSFFEFDDITWLVYNDFSSSNTASDNQILVKLQGVGYEEADLAASFGNDA